MFDLLEEGFRLAREEKWTVLQNGGRMRGLGLEKGFGHPIG